MATNRIKIIYFLIFWLFSLQVLGEDMIITYVHPSPITIGGKKGLTEGSRFPKGSRVDWSSEKQYIKFQSEYGGPPLTRSAHQDLQNDKYLKGPSFRKRSKGSSRGSILLLDTTTVTNRKKFNGEKRIALVVGNSLYENIDELSTPVLDADDIKDKLLELGFDVFSIFDATSYELNSALKKFSSEASTEHYDVALFYYAGHGVQNGEMSYILPVDAKTSSTKYIIGDNGKGSWISFSHIYDYMSETGCKSNLVFIDACRESIGDIDTLNQQPSHLDVKGSLVIYSTTPKEIAADITNIKEKHSPFAKAFLEAIEIPATSIDMTLDSINAIVEKETGTNIEEGNKQRIYRFKEGNCDFIFIKQKYSKEQCLNAANKAEELLKEGYPYEAIKLSLNYIPKNKTDNTIPYISKFDSILRYSIDSLENNKWFFIRYDSKGLLTKDNKYILSEKDNCIYVYDALSLESINVIKLPGETKNFLCGYLNDSIYVFDNFKIMTYSTNNNLLHNIYSYASLYNYEIIESIINFNHINYDRYEKNFFYNYYLEDSWDNRFNKHELNTMMHSIYSFLNIPFNDEILAYNTHKKLAVLCHKNNIEDDLYSILLYDCIHKKEILNITELFKKNNIYIGQSIEQDGGTNIAFSIDGNSIFLTNIFKSGGYIIDINNYSIKTITCGQEYCDHYSNWYSANRNKIIHSSRFESCVKIFDFDRLTVNDSIVPPSSEEIFEGEISNSGNECWIHVGREKMICKKFDFYHPNKNSFDETEYYIMNFFPKDTIIDNRFHLSQKSGKIYFTDLNNNLSKWNLNSKNYLQILDIIDNQYLVIADTKRFSDSDYLIVNISDGSIIYKIYAKDNENYNLVLYDKKNGYMRFVDSYSNNHKDYFIPNYNQLIESCLDFINNNSNNNSKNI